MPVPNSEQVPTPDACAGDTDLGWVAEDPAQVTVNPGKSVLVTVSFDATAAGIAQPATLTGALGLEEDTPYDVADVALSLAVTPPRTWGQVAGVVTGVNCDGKSAPLSGAVVQINSWAQRISVVTDAGGHYAYWLDRRQNPLRPSPPMTRGNPRAGRCASPRAGRPTRTSR